MWTRVTKKLLHITHSLFSQHSSFSAFSAEQWQVGRVLRGKPEVALLAGRGALHCLWVKCGKKQMKSLHAATANSPASIDEYLSIRTKGRCHFPLKFPLIPQTHLNANNTLYGYNTEHVYKSLFFFHYCLHYILSAQCVTNPKTNL